VRPSLCIGRARGATDAAESGYFAVRGVLARGMTQAACFIAERGTWKKATPFSFDS